MQKQHRMSLFILALATALALAARTLPSRVYPVQTSSMPVTGLQDNRCCLTNLRRHDTSAQRICKYRIDRKRRPKASKTNAQVVVGSTRGFKPALPLGRVSASNSVKRPLCAGSVSAKINLNTQSTILLYRMIQVKSATLTRISVTPLTRGPTPDIC